MKTNKLLNSIYFLIFKTSLGNVTDGYNNCFAIGIFPKCSKIAEVTPTYKKDKPTEKTNCRPILHTLKDI